ncbi:MAG: Ig-like domain-containing protein [Natrialbaceae archaeon]|nr:Ig-like domain-containing protein [Natrialbaceae archaeon]
MATNGTFVAGPPADIDATVTADNAVANGTDEVEVTVTVEDATGNPVENATVTVDNAGDVAALDGIGAGDDEQTTVDGHAIFTATSTTSGNFTVQFSEPDAGNDTATVSFEAGQPSDINATVTADNAVANGTDEVEITVTVEDATGNPVENATVTVDNTGDVAVLDGIAAGDVEQTTEDGHAIFTATSTTSGNYTVQFSEPDAGNDTATVSFEAGEPDSIVVRRSGRAGTDGSRHPLVRPGQLGPRID